MINIATDSNRTNYCATYILMAMACYMDTLYNVNILL